MSFHNGKATHGEAVNRDLLIFLGKGGDKD